MGSIFRYSVVSPQDDYGTGSLTPNGTWTGAIGRILKRVCKKCINHRQSMNMLQLFVELYKEVDIGAAPFSVTYTRRTVIDFTVSFYEEPTAILIPAPTPGKESLSAYMKPFQLKVISRLLLNKQMNRNLLFVLLKTRYGWLY